MIIKLRKSKLFTVKPAKRFAKEFGVNEKVWVETWFRYKMKAYSIKDMRDYINIKSGKKPSYDCVYHWIMKTEIYSRSREAFSMGAEIVKSEFFGEYESYVIKMLTRHMKSGNTRSSKSIV